MAAGRAAAEIGQTRACAIESRRDRLGGDHALMHGAMAPVDDALGMARAELEVAALVAGIGGDADIAVAQARGDLAVVETVAVGAVTHHVESPAPRGQRQPDLEPDLRSFHRRRHTPDPAEG